MRGSSSWATAQPGLLDLTRKALPLLTADSVEVAIEPAERPVRVAAFDDGRGRPVPYAALIVTVGASSHRTVAALAHPLV